MKRVWRFLKALWKYILYGKRVSFRRYVTRLEMCSCCSNFNSDTWTCKICGCHMDKKAKMSTEKCPNNAW